MYEIVYSMTYWPVAGLSGLVFLYIFNNISPTLSYKFCSGYRDLTKAQQIDWNTRIVSSVHSSLVSLFCLYIILYDTAIVDDPIWGHSPLVRTNTAIVSGYAILDILIVMKHYDQLGEVGYILHHMATLYSFYYVMTYGALPWFANYRLLAELSTPFVNNRWFLDVIHCPRTSPAFMWNGILMTVVFFCCRLITMPIYWHRAWSIYNTPPCIALGNIWYVMLTSCIVLDVLNIVWMHKMTMGAMKVLNTKYGWFSSYMKMKKTT